MRIGTRTLRELQNYLWSSLRTCFHANLPIFHLHSFRLASQATHRYHESLYTRSPWAISLSTQRHHLKLIGRLFVLLAAFQGHSWVGQKCSCYTFLACTHILNWPNSDHIQPFPPLSSGHNRLPPPPFGQRCWLRRDTRQYSYMSWCLSHHLMWFTYLLWP